MTTLSGLPAEVQWWLRPTGSGIHILRAAPQFRGIALYFLLLSEGHRPSAHQTAEPLLIRQGHRRILSAHSFVVKSIRDAFKKIKASSVQRYCRGNGWVQALSGHV
jgi:hypothetical protein